jgi:hypothetical protein
MGTQQGLWGLLIKLAGVVTKLELSQLTDEAICAIDVSFLLHKWARIHEKCALAPSLRPPPL